MSEQYPGQPPQVIVVDQRRRGCVRPLLMTVFLLFLAVAGFVKCTNAITNSNDGKERRSLQYASRQLQEDFRKESASRRTPPDEAWLPDLRRNVHISEIRPKMSHGRDPDDGAILFTLPETDIYLCYTLGTEPGDRGDLPSDFSRGKPTC